MLLENTNQITYLKRLAYGIALEGKKCDWDSKVMDHLYLSVFKANNIALDDCDCVAYMVNIYTNLLYGDYTSQQATTSMNKIIEKFSKIEIDKEVA